MKKHDPKTVTKAQEVEPEEIPEQPKAPLPELKASPIPVVEAPPPDANAKDACAIPPDEDFTEGIYYMGSEPFTLCIHPEDGYGRTHTLKNTLHLWQGTKEEFAKTFSHKSA